MGVFSGPDVSENGLVLALDGANIKSFKGEATTNELVAITWAGDGTAQAGMSFGSTAVTEEYLKYKGYETYLWSPGSSLNCYLNGGDVDVNRTSTVWTFSCYVKREDGAAITSLNVYMYYPTSDGSAAGTIENVGNGWYRVSRTRTGTSSNITLAGFTGFVAGYKYYLSGAQLEKKSYATTPATVNTTRGTTVATGGGWADISGTGNNGELVNGVRENSANSGSLVFDATDDYINYGNILNFTTESFTFNIFFYLTSITTNAVNQGPILFYKGAFNSNGYYLQLTQANPSQVYFFTNQSGASQATTSSSSVVVGAWNNISVTRSGSSVRIYINGVDATLSAGTHINPASSSDNFQLAAYTLAIFANIRIASFQAYNRALTAAEIQQNYNAIKSRFAQDGSSAERAAPSASYISSLGIRADGDYWYLPPGQTTPIQLYTVFSSAPAGKGYVLVARGRESTDWWNTNGQNTSALTSTSINTNTPIAVLSNSFVNSLINSQWNGMRFITNRINGGDSWLFVGTTSTTFSWTYFNQVPSTVNATATKYNGLFLSGGVALNYSTGVNWTDTLNYGGGNNCDRTFTWSWSGHGTNQGWSGGSTCTPAGAFQLGAEGHSIQLVNCYIEC